MARIPHSELIAWQVLYGLEPWGELRSDMAAARVAHAVVATTPTKRRKRYKLADFMPDFWGDLKRAQARSIFEAFRSAKAAALEKQRGKADSKD